MTFSYDQTSVTLGSWSSGTLTNPLGRLTEAVTTSGGNVQTGVVYSYDPMGRPNGYWQCTPYNCGSASIWGMAYTYDLAGDITSWTHPSGYTITNTVSPAQRITQISSSQSDWGYPPTLAQNVTYTAWGALSTLEDGNLVGYTNTQETYTYNNRLQPTMIELGTPTSPSANMCLVYNYYASLGNPSSCAPPSQGSGDNGNVMGYYDLDNSGTATHTEAYAYDTVNRLTSAVATGNSTYNLSFIYDRYGNMACQTNAQTNGPCPNWTFKAANQISGYTYDAAGNLTGDGSHSYQYDAEGRLATIDSGATATYTYNALGQEVRIWNGDYLFDNVYDLGGAWIGRWYNANSWQVSGVFHLGGRPFAIYIGGMDFVHVNAVGSTASNTDVWGDTPAENLFYPWGELWQGGESEWHYAAFPYADFAVNLFPAPFRQYSYGQGRWLTPDPSAGDVTNPQSLNRYSYVLNNPTTLNDPTGLQAGGKRCQVPFL